MFMLMRVAEKRGDAKSEGLHAGFVVDPGLDDCERAGLSVEAA